MTYIISADDIKKTLPGYDPNHSDKMHKESAKLADKKYADTIKNRPEHTVILMSGGTASGKTEYISAYLRRRQVIVFDGTMPTFNGAKIKIKKALKHHKKLEVHAVIPTSLDTAFIAFLNRDRKFPPKHFFNTHSSSRKTLLEIAKSFPDIQIKIFFSKYKGDDAKEDTKFRELSANNRGELIDFLENNQYTKEEIMRKQGLL